MKGEKQVTFPFEFKYSDGGVFKTDYGITVRAPSLNQFAVHTAMVAFAAEADRANQAAGLVAFSSISAEQLSTLLKSRGDNGSGDEAAPVESDRDMANRVIGQFASGLGSEKFPKFMEFLLKTLKNNAKLATVGDTKIPLTDATVDSIAEIGGMDAINLILASFAGFFLPDQAAQSPKPNGGDTPTTQPSAVAVH